MSQKPETIGVLMGVPPLHATDPVSLKFFPCTQDEKEGFIATPEMSEALRTMMYPLVCVRMSGREVIFHFIGNLHGLEGSVMKASEDINNIEGYDELLSIVEKANVN